MDVRQEINLSTDEAVNLIKNLHHPSSETLAKRDRFLASTQNYTVTRISDTSFSVDIPDLDLSFLDVVENYAGAFFEMDYSVTTESCISYGETIHIKRAVSEQPFFSEGSFLIGDSFDRASLYYEKKEAAEADSNTLPRVA